MKETMKNVCNKHSLIVTRQKARSAFKTYSFNVLNITIIFYLKDSFFLTSCAPIYLAEALLSAPS